MESIVGGHENLIWLFGMCLNIFGSIMVNFGTNLMKSAHNIALKDNALEGEVRETSKYTLTSKQIWSIGMTIFVVGSLVNFASFAFAAQSLLACLGTVQFVSNVFFAKFVLGETLTPRIIMATAVIVIGLVIAILCSNHATELYSTNDLINLYTTSYVSFIIIVIGVLVIMHILYVIYTAHEESGSPLPQSNLIRPVTYSIVSATIGTQSVLQSKCLAELIKASFEDENQLTHWFFYVILAAFLVGLSFWLYRMNAALKKFDGLIIIPLLQVFWTTSAILQGGVYFQEFQKFTALQTFGFCGGVAIVFIGVYFLTPEPAASEDDKESVTSESAPLDRSLDSFYKRKAEKKDYFANYEDIDESTRSLISLGFMPVVVESLPKRRLSDSGHNEVTKPSTFKSIAMRATGKPVGYSQALDQSSGAVINPVLGKV